MITHVTGLRRVLVLDLVNGLVLLALFFGANAVFDWSGFSSGFTVSLIAAMTASIMMTDVLQHQKRQAHGS